MIKANIDVSYVGTFFPEFEFGLISKSMQITPEVTIKNTNPTCKKTLAVLTACVQN